MYEKIVKIGNSTRIKSYLKCVWIKRINNAIQANSKKSETKLVGILYFLPGTFRKSLALTESNKIFMPQPGHLLL